MISTHTPLAGRDVPAVTLLADKLISTHTPLAGRDTDRHLRIQHLVISTHTPLAGRDMLSLNSEKSISDFYSHAPRGARQKTM